MKKLWPIIERELRSLAQSRQIAVQRAAVGFLGIVFTLLIAVTDHFSEYKQPNLGLVMLGTQTFFLITFSLFAGMFLTSDSISSEKREGTLGLLYLTDLKTIHIVMGKVFASSFVAFMCLIAMLPVLSLSLLYGGVTLQMIFIVFLIAANNLLFSLVAGIFASVQFTQARTTNVATFLIVFGLQFGFPIFMSFAEDRFSPTWALNAYAQLGAAGMGGVFGGVARQISSAFFIWGQISVFAITIVLFFFSVSRLSRSWRLAYDPDATKKKKTKSKKTTASTQSTDALQPAPQPQVQVAKQKFSDRGGLPLTVKSPLNFIFSRKSPEVASGVFSIVFCFLFLGILSAINGMDEPSAGLTGLILFNIIFKFQWASAVVSVLNRERRDGTLEFLLSTPLDVNSVIPSLKKVLLHDLKITIGVAAVWNALMILIIMANGGFDHPIPWILLISCLILLFVDLAAITHSGAWLGLTNLNFSQGLLKTYVWVVCLPTWIVWFLFTLGTIFIQVTGIYRNLPFNDDILGYVTFIFWFVLSALWGFGCIKFPAVWLPMYIRLIASLPHNAKISFKSLNQHLNIK